MLLTLTNTQHPATDLGFLLHKHPDRAQRYSLSFGAAHVFYPEAGEARCTACLLVDVDPVELVMSRPGVSADHLRAGIHRQPASGAAAETLARLKSGMMGGIQSIINWENHHELCSH
jgi:hypothetical protein